MATTVDLNLGGAAESGGQTYTADLVLTSPYTPPEGNLLVLRSTADIAAITGTLAVTGADDTADFDGNQRLPVSPSVGTIAVVGQSDTVSVSAVVAPRNATGTCAVTNTDDSASAVGDGYAGIGARSGVIAVTESPDTAAVESVWTMLWKATVAATDINDTGALTGGFTAYYGPGFVNTTSADDTVSATGRIVYNVTTTVAATEAADVVAIVLNSNEAFSEETIDIVLVSDSLTGDVDVVSLVSRVIVTDLLQESPDVASRDTLGVSDALTSVIRLTASLSDTVSVSDSFSDLVDGVISDTVTVSDTITGLLAFVAVDTLTLSESWETNLVVSSSLLDTVNVTDTIGVGFLSTTTDSVVVSETLSSVITQYGLLSDVVNVATPTITTLTSSTSTVERGLIQDSLTSILLSATSDTVTFTDTSVISAYLVAGLTDTVTLTEALTGAVTVYAPLVADTVEFTDTLLGSLQLVGVLAETVLVGDTLNEAAQTVYVINAETGAVSTYQFTPMITGMTEYRGVLYLAGPDGLYALDADQDEDGSVVWSLRTGFSNLGTDALKRLRDANFQARTEGETTFQVVSDRYGDKQEWNYRLPELHRDSYRDGVVKVGRGIQSVYWQFAAQGIGPAEIDQLRLSVEPLSRRR